MNKEVDKKIIEKALEKIMKNYDEVLKRLAK